MMIASCGHTVNNVSDVVEVEYDDNDGGIRSAMYCKKCTAEGKEGGWLRVIGMSAEALAVEQERDMKAVLEQRLNTHGDFRDQFALAQDIKSLCRSYARKPMNDQQREAIDMIIHKISRIVTGNPNHMDHWRDIAGYATLIAGML